MLEVVYASGSNVELSKWTNVCSFSSAVGEVTLVSETILLLLLGLFSKRKSKYFTESRLEST